MVENSSIFVYSFGTDLPTYSNRIEKYVIVLENPETNV